MEIFLGQLIGFAVIAYIIWRFVVPPVKTLMAKARRAQAKRGIVTRKKTAAVAEPLQAMLDTCTDGLRGLRDRALLLAAWSGGGRRRSELVALQVGDLRRLRPDTWTYALGRTKSNATGPIREKPLRGEAAHAVTQWIEAAHLTDGPSSDVCTVTAPSARRRCPATRSRELSSGARNSPDSQGIGQHTACGRAS